MQSHADYSLFTKSCIAGFTAILVYVDYLVLASDNLEEIQAMKQLLDAKFRIKDLGPLKFFLGMEVALSHHSIALYQRKYAGFAIGFWFVGCQTSLHTNGLYS